VGAVLFPPHFQEVIMAEMQYVNQTDFKTEVIDSSLPVLVDFTAVWCGPCKMIAPIVEQLSVEWQGKVKVVKCDADKNPDIIVQYGIMGIPTLMLFKGGAIKERISGYMPKDKLVARLTPHV
jgi:thioredoxin 1